MIAWAALLVASWLPLLPQVASDEAAIRGLVQQYFDAQVREDIDAVLAFWDPAAGTRPTRETLAAVFDTGDDQYTIVIRAVAIDGDEARVRVEANRVRTVTRGGATSTFRFTVVNAEIWKREAGAWKLTRERPAAEDLADELLAASPDERDRLLAANADLVNVALRNAIAARASRMAMGQQYREAKAAFELVLLVARTAHDRAGEGDALQNLANAHYFLREYAQAEAYYQQRLALAREMNDEEATAASMLGIATIAYSSGEYASALGSYRDALEIYERREEEPSIGRTLVSVGNVQLLQADFDAASASYRRALALLTKGFDLPGAALARSGLARVLAAQGDVGGALDFYGQVLADARERNSRGDVAAALENIGELHFRIRNTDQARAAFDEARRLCDSLGDPAGAGRLLGDLGLTELISGKFDAALAAYVDSRGHFEQAHAPEGIARAWVGIGFSQTARKKYPEAIAAYRTAIAASEQQTRPEDAGRAWLGLSMAQSAAGDAPAALESAVRVRTIADTVINTDLKWRAAVRQGEVLRSLDRLEDAQRTFEEAISGIERLTEEAPTNADARAQLDESASAWTGLAFTLAQRGDAAGALAAAEQRRAHLRRLVLAPFERDISRGATTGEREEEARIVRDLISARAQLRAERSAPKPDPARADRLQRKLDTLIAQRGDQQQALYSRLPDLRLWRGLQPPPPLTGFATLLPDDQAIAVEYVVGDDELLILSLMRRDTGPDVAARIVAFDRRDVADLLTHALEPASLRDAAEWRKRSAPLAEALVRPIAERLQDCTRVVLLPDDLLWKVPFEALELRAGGFAPRARITYATSLATLALEAPAVPRAPSASPDATEARSPVKFGVVTAPDLALPVRAQLGVTRPAWRPPDADAALAGARRLLTSYGDAPQIYSGSAATEDAVRDLLSSADVVQLDVPLQLSVATPLLSAALLAGTGDTAANDGRFQVREWFASTMHARVAVFGDANSFGAAGVGGAIDAVAWAAASAGLPSLVFARWPADGYVLDPLFTALHERLARGLEAGDALREAMAAVRAKDGDGPARWAGLRLIGGRP